MNKSTFQHFGQYIGWGGGVVKYGFGRFLVNKNNKYKKKIKKTQMCIDDMGKGFTEVLWNVYTQKLNFADDSCLIWYLGLWLDTVRSNSLSRKQMTPVSLEFLFRTSQHPEALFELQVWKQGKNNVE